MTTPITTTTQLEALPEQSVILDTWGDVGIISDGYVHYPETDPVAFEVALTWAPLTVLWPLPAPAVKPGREAAHTAGGRAYSEGGGVEDVVDAVLAILPGKSEAQVRAEALRDAKARIALDFTYSGHEVAAWLDALDALADEEAGK